MGIKYLSFNEVSHGIDPVQIKAYNLSRELIRVPAGLDHQRFGQQAHRKTGAGT
jgi:hypothetical protein